MKSAKAPSTSAALASEDLNKATPTPASPAKSVHDELGLDEATKRELRLDLGGIEGSIDAEVSRSSKISQSHDSLNLSKFNYI